MNLKLIIFILSLITLSSCNDTHKEVPFYDLPADYNKITLIPTNDTLKLPLDSLTRPNFRSFNCTELNNEKIFSFVDKLTRQLNIYSLNQLSLIKKIPLSKIIRTKSTSKFSAFFKNYDSIYVHVNKVIYQLDTSGIIKDSIVVKGTEYYAQTQLYNYSPLVLANNHLYVPAIPILDVQSKKDLKKWKLLYDIDLKSKTCSLRFPLPNYLIKNTFTRSFLYSYYCYNPYSQRFLFSIPAETNIYQSDSSALLAAYSGRSKAVDKTIAPFSSRDYQTSEEEGRAKFLRDAYGPIYFDPYYKRYIRIVEKGLSDQEYKNKDFVKSKRAVILDSAMKIIGDSPIPKTIDTNTIFFTKDGIFARLNLKVKEEDYIYIIKLTYK